MTKETFNKTQYLTYLTENKAKLQAEEERTAINGLLEVLATKDIDAESLYERINLVMRYANPKQRNAYIIALLPIEDFLSNK